MKIVKWSKHLACLKKDQNLCIAPYFSLPALLLVFGLFLIGQTVHAQEINSDSKKLMSYLDKHSVWEAESYLDSMAQSEINHLDQAVLLYGQGRIAIKKGKHNFGKKLLHQALSQFEPAEYIHLYGQINYILALRHMHEGKQDSFQIHIDKILGLKDNPNKNSIRGSLIGAYNLLGVVYRRKGLLDKSIHYYELGLSECVGEHRHIVNIFYANLANLHTDTKNHFVAMEYLFRSIRLLESNNDTMGLAGVYGKLAGIYSYDRNAMKSIEMLDKAEEYLCAKIRGNRKYYNGLMRQYGGNYMILEDYQKAIDYYRQAESHCDEEGEKFYCLQHTLNLARAYIKVENYTLAKTYLDKAERLLEENQWGDHKDYLFTFKGKYYLAIGDPQKALHYFTQSLKIKSDLNRSVEEYRESYKLVSDAYKDLGNSAKALDYAEKSFQMVDSILHSPSPNEYEAFFAKLELEKEQTKSEQRNKFTTELADRRGKINILLTVAALLLLAGMFLLWRLLQLRKKYTNQLDTKIEEKTQELAHSKEELERTHNELKLFYAAIAHDLRYPILYVQNNLDKLSEKLPSTEQKLIGNSNAALENLYESFVRLLEFFRMEEESLNIKNIKLGILVPDVVKELDRILVLEKLTVETDDLPSIEGDILLIRFILINLITNAVKFTRSSSSPQLKISSKTTPTHVHLFFQDNGEGVNPAIKNKIFDSFVSGRKIEKESLGIGLFMVKRMMERHQGTVNVTTNEFGGATFELLFKK